MDSKLCRNCFAALPEGPGNIPCPSCGWDNSKSQPRDALPFDTVLAGRYQVGRAKARNGEGFTYAALDLTNRKTVEVREFFPTPLAAREGVMVEPVSGQASLFGQYLDDFIELSKGISRLREASVVQSVLEIFQENGTAYTVYEDVPSMSLRRFVEQSGGGLGWNQVNTLFQPVLSALGLMNSLGLCHLGVSPETLRITREGRLLMTGFSIQAARHAGSGIEPDLYPGCAAVEQYDPKAVCGEVTDVYGFTATLLYCLTGQMPLAAPKRLQDQRLMISREVLKTLPPFAVTAIANGMQVKQSLRTGSFQRFKTELSSAPSIVNQVDETDAIRRLPPVELDLPKNRGLPPVVWLLGSCVITLVALLIVASLWLGEQGMSFADIKKIFQDSSSAAQTLEVPQMVNESYEEWEQQVGQDPYDFTLKISTREFSDTVEEGNIISQDPFPGETIAPGGTVLVTVSKGSATRTLPGIDGISFADLQTALTEDGFSPVKGGGGQRRHRGGVCNSLPGQRPRRRPGVRLHRHRGGEHWAPVRGDRGDASRRITQTSSESRAKVLLFFYPSGGGQRVPLPGRPATGRQVQSPARASSSRREGRRRRSHTASRREPRWQRPGALPSAPRGEAARGPSPGEASPGRQVQSPAQGQLQQERGEGSARSHTAEQAVGRGG